MDSTLLENLVKALRNQSFDSQKPHYESFLGDPVTVKSYANTGVQCAGHFATAIAIIIHEYDVSAEDKTSVEHRAYRKALGDFVGFFEGCVKEAAQAQPSGPKPAA